jgi:hypothetical protein
MVNDGAYYMTVEDREWMLKNQEEYTAGVEYNKFYFAGRDGMLIRKKARFRTSDQAEFPL